MSWHYFVFVTLSWRRLYSSYSNESDGSFSKLGTNTLLFSANLGRNTYISGSVCSQPRHSRTLQKSLSMDSGVGECIGGGDGPTKRGELHTSCRRTCEGNLWRVSTQVDQRKIQTSEYFQEFLPRIWPGIRSTPNCPHLIVTERKLVC